MGEAVAGVIAPGRRRVMILALAAFWLLADQLTKWLVRTDMQLHQSISTPGDLVYITYIHNRGGAFGLFQGASTLFLATGFLVTLILLWTLPRAHQLGVPTALAYGLILGGALGNLIDRLRYGYVVDFLDLNFWPLVDWPVFNVADIGISVGITLLVLTGLRGEGPVASGRSLRSAEGEPERPVRQGPDPVPAGSEAAGLPPDTTS